MAIFLFLVFFISFCLLKESKSTQPDAPRITPEMLLSRKGKPLYGAALQARIKKLEAQGYIL